MKKRSRILYFLQEVIIVVIGVLIAVSIGNYKEKLDNENYIEKTLLSIENEIKVSQSEIDTVLEKHIKLYEKLKNKWDDQEQPIGEVVTSSGGFQIASIKNVSLRFFVSNKAELLDFGLISQLLDIELKTNILSKKIERLSNFVYDHVNETDKDPKIKFAYLLGDVIDGEQTLLEAYSKFLDENKTYLKNKTP